MEKRSLPLAAGATMVQVSGDPEQAGLLGVRLLAIEAGEPVYAVPFTLSSVMMIDWVELETNAGLRASADVVLLAGRVIVKRALAGVNAGLVPIGAGAVAACIPVPPEQLHNPHSASKAKIRVRISSPERSAS